MGTMMDAPDFQKLATQFSEQELDESYERDALAAIDRFFERNQTARLAKIKSYLLERTPRKDAA